MGIYQNGSWGTVWEGVELMHLAHDRDKWWALVNVVMDPGVP
jgi:hypothetical protein